MAGRWSIRGRAALALFSGVVRDQTGGRRVKFLEYEAHGPMAAGQDARDRGGHPAALARHHAESPSCTASAGSRSASRA